MRSPTLIRISDVSLIWAPRGCDRCALRLLEISLICSVKFLARTVFRIHPLHSSRYARHCLSMRLRFEWLVLRFFHINIVHQCYVSLIICFSYLNLASIRQSDVNAGRKRAFSYFRRRFRHWRHIGLGHGTSCTPTRILFVLAKRYSSNLQEIYSSPIVFGLREV